MTPLGAELVLEGHGDVVTCVSWESATMAWTGGFDHALKCWDADGEGRRNRLKRRARWRPSRRARAEGASRGAGVGIGPCTRGIRAWGSHRRDHHVELAQ